MATKSLCSVPDCDKIAKAPTGEPRRYFEEVVLSCESDDCLTWPYSKSQKGYGKMWASCRVVYVHRLACEVVNGAPPTSKHQAAHSCGNGHLGCVNPKHLRWATRAENWADMLIHETHNRGVRNRKTKITHAQARQVLALKGTMSQPKIAEKVGITHAIVSHILHGHSWRWLSEEPSP